MSFPAPRKYGAILCLASLVTCVPISGYAQNATTTPATADNGNELAGPLLLRDESVDQVLALLEKLTGRIVLRPQALPTPTLTLSLNRAVPKAEAIRAIETVLALNGIAVTPLDTLYLKVTPLNTAKAEAPELISGSTLGLPASGRIASKLFRLQFLKVAEVIPQISGVLNPTSGAPALFEKANTVLITDSVSNLQRVEILIQQLDRAELAGLSPKFYPIKYAKASEVVSKMQAMLTGTMQSQPNSGTIFSADDRTNQIVLFCDPEKIPVFDQLISKLDVHSGQDTRNDVISLKHASAKEVATILSQLVAGQNNATRNNGQSASAPNSPRPATPAQASSPQPVPAPVAPAAPSIGVALEPSAQFSSLLTILPEDRSNSLIVSGTTEDIRLINELVARIDVLLAQVRIEVVIAEVSLGNNATSGISALGLKFEGDKLTSFSGSAAGIGVENAVITRPGVVGAGPLDLAAEINLMTTPRKSNATILSQPNIITTHNREGKIFVGEERPVISSYLNDGNSGGVVGGGYRSTVTSKDIGISLIVKPLIGADGSVQLEIKQEVNDILGDITIDGNPQPRVGRRSTESFVSVKSGDIIVLGGLQRTSQSRSTSRLGPVPIIGDLLGSRSRENTRTDLVFFLRPVVLKNTAADNAPAMKQIESFPKGQREQVKEALRVSDSK